jgi:AcrR family transcriptional regulator
LPQRSQVLLEPLKSPVQAGSAASVDAILQATIQVLLNAGKERLTTTRVALRAGVSVGTLHQYFPNKSVLLQAALKRHLAEVTEAVEVVCKEQEDKTLRQMATAVVDCLCGTQRPTVAILGLHRLRRTSPVLLDSLYCIDATVAFRLKPEK